MFTYSILNYSFAVTNILHIVLKIDICLHTKNIYLHSRILIVIVNARPRATDTEGLMYLINTFCARKFTLLIE